MDLWHVILFAAASLLALRSFVTLTNHHQRYTLQKLIREQKERLQQQAAADAAKSPKAVA